MPRVKINATAKNDATEEEPRDQPTEHPAEHQREHHPEHETRTGVSQARKEAGNQPTFSKSVINYSTAGGKERLKEKGFSEELFGKIGTARKGIEKLAPRSIPRKKKSPKEPNQATAKKQKKALWTDHELKQHTKHLTASFTGNKLEQCVVLSLTHETKTDGTPWEEEIMPALSILNGMEQDIMASIVDYGHVRKKLPQLEKTNWHHGLPPRKDRLATGFWPRVFAGYKLVDERKKSWVKQAGKDLAYLRWKKKNKPKDQELDDAVQAVETEQNGKMVVVYHLSKVDQDLWDNRMKLIYWIIKIIYLEWRAHLMPK
jgi:hypothetical protein